MTLEKKLKQLKLTNKKKGGGVDNTEVQEPPELQEPKWEFIFVGEKTSFEEFKKSLREKPYFFADIDESTFEKFKLENKDICSHNAIVDDQNNKFIEDSIVVIYTNEKGKDFIYAYNKDGCIEFYKRNMNSPNFKKNIANSAEFTGDAADRFKELIKENFTLIGAINKGNIKRVKKLLSDNSNIKEIDKDGFTPLHYAVLSKQINNNLLKYLLRNNNILSLINTKNNNGNTPLHYVADYGFTIIVKLLLEKGANVNANDIYNKIPLHYAVDKGHTEIVKLLLEKGADVNAKDYKGRIPLHYAVNLGNIEIIKELLEKGANVKAIDKEGFTPLRLAAYYGRTKIVEELLNKGADADVNVNDYYGRIPLHFAVYEGHKDIVKLLLEKNSNVNAKDKNDRTPLYHAIYKDLMEIVKELLKHPKIKVNTKDKDGKTPLHYAVELDKENIVKELLKKEEINVNATDKDDKTPLHYAKNKNNDKIIKILEEALEEQKIPIISSHYMNSNKLQTINNKGKRLLNTQDRQDTKAKKQKNNSKNSK